MWIFNIYIFSFSFFLEHVSIPPIPLDCAFSLFCFLGFFSQNENFTCATQPNYRKCSTKWCFLSTAPSTPPGPTWRGLVPLHIWEQGEFLQLSILLSWNSRASLNCVSIGKFYTKQKWDLLQNQFYVLFSLDPIFTTRERLKKKKEKEKKKDMWV